MAKEEQVLKASYTIAELSSMDEKSVIEDRKAPEGQVPFGAAPGAPGIPGAELGGGLGGEMPDLGGGLGGEPGGMAAPPEAPMGVGEPGGEGGGAPPVPPA